ncbi:hypothetical protein SAMN05660860_02483 [Geoalkalibacter ferrihydriticus]|uniref:Uncharacterized protein n=1 Tax=Geoalkalibacter ferrihydriticus TaxID=392333 RepID=A0A1G9T4Q5_9BACT|nr:hypothetical protein [Geoalkalibacter ferrihydriticus]SDM42607.1 hypothetical protein SAMN05660860_02483 [Geoalkalibacter ferrihydriticus]
MTKFIVLLVGIVWACLLFISWGQADGIIPPQPETSRAQQR